MIQYLQSPSLSLSLWYVSNTYIYLFMSFGQGTKQQASIQGTDLWPERRHVAVLVGFFIIAALTWFGYLPLDSVLSSFLFVWAGLAYLSASLPLSIMVKLQRKGISKTLTSTLSFGPVCHSHSPDIFDSPNLSSMDKRRLETFHTSILYKERVWVEELNRKHTHTTSAIWCQPVVQQTSYRP